MLVGGVLLESSLTLLGGRVRELVVETGVSERVSPASNEARGEVDMVVVLAKLFTRVR